MIDRIGALKPKKFAKFDMTKGYWQLGLWKSKKLLRTGPFSSRWSFCFLCSFLHRFPLPFSYFLCRYGGIFCLLRRRFLLSMEHTALVCQYASSSYEKCFNCRSRFIFHYTAYYITVCFNNSAFDPSTRPRHSYDYELLWPTPLPMISVIIYCYTYCTLVC